MAARMHSVRSVGRDRTTAFYDLKWKLQEAARQVKTVRLFLEERCESGIRDPIVNAEEIQNLLAVLDPATQTLLDKESWSRAEREALDRGQP